MNDSKPNDSEYIYIYLYLELLLNICYKYLPQINLLTFNISAPNLKRF